MIVLRRSRARSSGKPNPKRQRVLMFLFLWFVGIGYLQAQERQRESEARSTAEREFTAMCVGIRMAAARRQADSRGGVEVCLVSDLEQARWVTVGVKELGGPWSPSSRTVLVPPRSAVRFELPRAIGERIGLFASGLPVDSDIDRPFPKAEGLLQTQDLAWGQVFVADDEGRFVWNPQLEWLIVVQTDDPVTWEGERIGLAEVREVLRGADPEVLGALTALAARSDIEILRVGAGSPLLGRLPPGRQDCVLRPWATVHLAPGGPRPRPLRLQVLRAPRPPSPVGVPG